MQVIPEQCHMANNDVQMQSTLQSRWTLVWLTKDGDALTLREIGNVTDIDNRICLSDISVKILSHPGVVIWKLSPSNWTSFLLG